MGFAIVSILFAIIALGVAGKMLVKLGWFAAWLRGTLGLICLVLGIGLMLAGIDFMSYKRLSVDKPILTISFERLGEQYFQATLLDIERGGESSFEIHGEQWQVDARIIRWEGLMQTFGARPGYRLDRLSGRYYSLEDERRKQRSVHQLVASRHGLDMWKWVQEHGHYIPLVDAVYGSATFLPMEDGAIFEISLSASGLAARPMNTIAQDAVSRWQ